MKRVVRAAWVVISLALIIQLIHSIQDLGKRGNVVEEVRLRLQKEQNENSRLKNEALYTESIAFVEEQARNKLNMSKKGESVVILPKPSSTPTPTVVAKRENWELWMEVFRVL